MEGILIGDSLIINPAQIVKVEKDDGQCAVYFADGSSVVFVDEAESIWGYFAAMSSAVPGVNRASSGLDG
jgi:hypothetical protein